jgi:hypothetical protein
LTKIPVMGRPHLPSSFTHRPEAVRSVPAASGPAVDIDARLEPGELPCPVRESAQSETGRQIECAPADRSVAIPRVEDDITVQQARRNSSRLVIKDLRADFDLGQIDDVTVQWSPGRPLSCEHSFVTWSCPFRSDCAKAAPVQGERVRAKKPVVILKFMSFPFFSRI